MERRESFNTAAQLYDEARPSYPDVAIDWILDRTNIGSDDTLLEIGPGTGQATLKFAERGYKIRGVELGQNMADMLMQKVGNYNVTVDVGPFETWEPRTALQIPLIYSATAFHWIDEDVRYHKTHDLLKDGGHLALLFNSATDRSREEVKEAQELLRKYHTESMGERGFSRDTRWTKEIADSGYFSLVDHLDYNWKMEITKDRLTKAFYSQSAYLSLDDEAKKEVTPQVEEVFSGLDDVFESNYKTTVYLAKKK